METDFVIPKRVSIETIYGCNASCVMCPIDIESPRKKGVMNEALTDKIFDELAPHVGTIDKVDLFGLGEPLLDPHLISRIQKAKSLGFRNIAISTNAELLNEEKRSALLESGIDTVIFSIDGFLAETHENIRRKLHFNKVVANCRAMIGERDAGGFRTRFVVRFIRQDANRGEWDDYARYWSEVLSEERNDLLIRYDAHSWSGSLSSKDAHLQALARDPCLEMKPCWHVFEHLVVLADGTVPLCSEDWHKATVKFGNADKESVLAIFNNKKYARIRTLHSLGTKTKIPLCGECTVHYSSSSKLEVVPRYETP
ncbi:MAG: radical SAM protein [Verrucomicrobiae bacterium]